jgi:hypothetical protein
MDLRVFKPLIDQFGEKNVESALIFITRAYDFRGLRVMIRPTPEMVRDVLEAVHGRLGVNSAIVRDEGLFQLKPTITKAPSIDSVFKPGTVKVSCGCTPERSARCLQRGRTREEDGSLNPESPLNKQCHVFVTEDELLGMARDVTDARFTSTKREERPPARAVDDDFAGLDGDDIFDLPQPVQPKRKKRATKKKRRKK